jgi:alpha-L-rhamnosidase
MLTSGATTAWEAWNGDGSRNHPAFGSVGAWFYQGLGGIRLDPAATAFKQIIIKPAVVGDLKWVKSSHQSLRGTIVSNWKLDGEQLHLEISVPVNTTATIHVPTTEPASVTESGQAPGPAGGVKFLGAEGNAAVYQVGSGQYTFEGRWTDQGGDGS